MPRPGLGIYRHRPYGDETGDGLRPPYVANALLVHGVLGGAAVLALGAAIVGIESAPSLMLLYQEGLPGSRTEPFTLTFRSWTPLALGSAVSGLLYWQLNWMVVRRRASGPTARLLFALALAPAGILVQSLSYYGGVYGNLAPAAPSLLSGLRDVGFAAILSTLALAVTPAGWMVFFPVALAQSVGSSLMLQWLSRERAVRAE